MSSISFSASALVHTIGVFIVTCLSATVTMGCSAADSDPAPHDVAPDSNLSGDAEQAWGNVMIAAYDMALQDKNWHAANVLVRYESLDRKVAREGQHFVELEPLSPEERNSVQRLEARLNGDDTAEIDFLDALPYVAAVLEGITLPDMKTMANFWCAPISCGGKKFASSDATKSHLLSNGYHEVPWPFTYGNAVGLDFAKSNFWTCKRTEAVICKKNCKGGCADGVNYTYYLEGPEPDPEPSACTISGGLYYGMSWTAYVAAYHATC